MHTFETFMEKLQYCIDNDSKLTLLGDNLSAMDWILEKHIQENSPIDAFLETMRLRASTVVKVNALLKDGDWTEPLYPILIAALYKHFSVHCTNASVRNVAPDLHKYLNKHGRFDDYPELDKFVFKHLSECLTLSSSNYPKEWISTVLDGLHLEGLFWISRSLKLDVYSENANQVNDLQEMKTYLEEEPSAVIELIHYLQGPVTFCIRELVVRLYEFLGCPSKENDDQWTQIVALVTAPLHECVTFDFERLTNLITPYYDHLKKRQQAL